MSELVVKLPAADDVDDVEERWNRSAGNTHFLQFHFSHELGLSET